MPLKKSAAERAMTATGMFRCRRCLEVLPLTAFKPRTATCVPCQRAVLRRYKLRMRGLEIRERRVVMLMKYLRAAVVEGECPVCGGNHLEKCSVAALLADLAQLGWDARQRKGPGHRTGASPDRQGAGIVR